MTIKDSKYVKINSVNPLYLMLNKMDGYFEEIYKYLTLVPTIQSKGKIKKYEELWDITRSVTKKSDDYDEKYIKINFVQMINYL